MAAHVCYLAAGHAPGWLEPGARLVLPGGDHRRAPRTFAAAAALQAAEVVEWARAAGAPLRSMWGSGRLAVCCSPAVTRLACRALSGVRRAATWRPLAVSSCRGDRTYTWNRQIVVVLCSIAPQTSCACRHTLCLHTAGRWQCATLCCARLCAPLYVRCAPPRSTSSPHTPVPRCACQPGCARGP